MKYGLIIKLQKNCYFSFRLATGEHGKYDFKIEKVLVWTTFINRDINTRQQSVMCAMLFYFSRTIVG